MCLDTVAQLFAEPVAIDDEGHETEERPPVMVFPQAFFQNYGHVKSDRIMSLVKPIVEEINQTLTAGNEDAYMDTPGREALTSGHCQMYNELTHRVAKKAGTQEVQRGDQTAAMAGHNPAYNARAKQRGKKFFDRCKELLPFKRHHTLIEPTHPEEDRPTNLRVESVYILDMNAVAPNKRTGK